jgi:hypothetical protein
VPRFEPTIEEVRDLLDGNISARQLAAHHHVATSTVTRYPETRAGKAVVRKIRALDLDAAAKRRRRARQAAERAGVAATDRPEVGPSDFTPRHMKPQPGGRILVDAMRRLNRPSGPGTLDPLVAERPRGWATTRASVALASACVRMFPPGHDRRGIPDRGKPIEPRDVPALEAEGWTRA